MKLKAGYCDLSLKTAVSYGLAHYERYERAWNNDLGGLLMHALKTVVTWIMYLEIAAVVLFFALCGLGIYVWGVMQWKDRVSITNKEE